MNKDQFLALLQDQLSVLPPEEAHELLEDYKAHFAFGRQNGKSEQDIARELGDPMELAREAVRERESSKGHVYWSNPVASPIQPPSAGHGPDRGAAAPPVVSHRRKPAATTLLIIGLVLLALLTVPLLLSLWAAAVSLAVSVAAGVLSPVLVLLDFALGRGFYPAKMYAALSMAGVGILLGLASRQIFKWMITLSKSYLNWNKRLIEGGNRYE